MTYTMASDLAREALEPGLTIAALQRAHAERQKEWCPDQKPDLSFRGNEMAGEVGEACNVIKKLERERHGWRGSRATVDDLGDELADTIHTAVLCAITAGIADLEARVVGKFNATSEKNGLATLLSTHMAAGAGPVRDATDAMIEAGLQVDMTNEDERGYLHNVWYAMVAAHPAGAAPVEEADAKAGEPFGWVKPESAHTREPRFIYAKDRIEDWMRAVFTVPVYASPPAPTIPSEPEAKGEAGAGPVGIPVDPETGMYDLTLANILRATREEAAYGPAHRAGAGPVGEAVAYLSRPVLAGFDPNGTEIANAMLYPKGTLRPHNEVAVYARPVDEPGEVERLTRERDEARAGCWIGDEEQRIRDLSSDVEEWKAHAKTAEAALAETRERLEKVEEAARPFVALAALHYPDDGGAPSLIDIMTDHGDQDEIELRGMTSTSTRTEMLHGSDFRALRAALSTQESSAALAGDGKEVGR